MAQTQVSRSEKALMMAGIHVDLRVASSHMYTMQLPGQCLIIPDYTTSLLVQFQSTKQAWHNIHRQFTNSCFKLVTCDTGVTHINLRVQVTPFVCNTTNLKK